MADKNELQVIIKARELAKHTLILTSNANRYPLLERIERGWIPDYNFSGSESDFENYQLHVALDRAIDCLKNKSSEI